MGRGRRERERERRGTDELLGRVRIVWMSFVQCFRQSRICSLDLVNFSFRLSECAQRKRG
jgi:hypothetical protein